MMGTRRKGCSVGRPAGDGGARRAARSGGPPPPVHPRTETKKRPSSRPRKGRMSASTWFGRGKRAGGRRFRGLAWGRGGRPRAVRLGSEPPIPATPRATVSADRLVNPSSFGLCTRGGSPEPQNQRPRLQRGGAGPHLGPEAGLGKQHARDERAQRVAHAELAGAQGRAHHGQDAECHKGLAAAGLGDHLKGGAGGAGWEAASRIGWVGMGWDRIGLSTSCGRSR